MSDKKLLMSIVNNSITNAGANYITLYRNGVADIKRADITRVNAMVSWDIVHNTKAVLSAARKKNASAEDKHAAEVVKVARAVAVDGTREKYAAACKRPRAEMSMSVKFFFGNGAKDESKKAAAFRNFYNAYTVYRKEFSENINTPAGRAVVSACVNMYSVCFGVTFDGKFGNKIARKTINVIGMRAARGAEERKGANGITVFTENEVKHMLIRIMYNLSLRGDFENMTRE